MIDDIVKMILKEARYRKGNNLAMRVFRVLTEVNNLISERFLSLLDKERKKKKDD